MFIQQYFATLRRLMEQSHSGDPLTRFHIRVSSSMNLLRNFVKQAGCTMHAIKSQQCQIAQKDHGKLFLSFSFFLPLSFSPGRGGRSRVFVVKPGSNAASTWSQVACRGYGARTSPSPGRNVHVSRSSSVATFDILPDPAHPVPCSIQA